MDMRIKHAAQRRIGGSEVSELMYVHAVKDKIGIQIQDQRLLGKQSGYQQPIETGY
jgi:hypothetical protein